jgi:hypothetical protein
MGIEPFKCNCERLAWPVISRINAAAKGKCGRVNASEVTDVGNGAIVVTDILAGAPFAGSAYDGYFQTITVEAFYPVSRYVPAVPPSTPASWERVREVSLKWTRTHNGDAIIPCSQQPTYEDEYEQIGYPLDDDEEIIPGSDEDPADFGTAYLILAISKVTASGQVAKSSLNSYVNDLPEEWSEYDAVAPVEFGPFGLSAGLIYDQGYEPGGHPSRASICKVKWTVSAAGIGNEGLPPMMGQPGYTLYQQSTILSIDLAEDEPEIEVIETGREGMPWREELGAFSKALDLSLEGVDGGGWEELNPGMSPGVVNIIEGYEYNLDIGLMWHI